MEASDDGYIETLNNGSIYKNDLLKAKSYNISEFDPETIAEQDGNISITAMTGAGKTLLIIDFLRKIHHKYDAIYLISRTAKAQKIYNIIPRTSIFDRFNEEFLLNLWNIHHSKKIGNLDTKLDKILIIMDDIINDDEYKRSKIINDYFTGGRHFSFNIWFLTQNFTSLKVLQRNNVRWAIAFDLDAEAERKKFVHSYLSAYNARVGMLLFDRIVKEKPYQCVIVEVYKNGASTEEKVKKYVADPSPPKFKVKENLIERMPLSFCSVISNMSLRTVYDEEKTSKYVRKPASRVVTKLL